MMATRCSNCQKPIPSGRSLCPNCSRLSGPLRKTEDRAGKRDEESSNPVTALLLDTEENSEIAVVSFAGRALFLLLLLVFSFMLSLHPMESNYAGESFLHYLNLPFHEAGHIIFSFFGRFIGVLGGSLAQLIVPVSVLVSFLYYRNPFAAGVGLWWLGESMMDLAPYINDARDLNLVLLGGVTGKDVDDYHDWEYLLRATGLLEWDHALARTAHALGILMLFCSLCWSGLVLWRQLGRLRQGS